MGTGAEHLVLSRAEHCSWSSENRREMLAETANVIHSKLWITLWKRGRFPLQILKFTDF